MKDIIRDSTVGRLVNIISGGRYLPYADQRSDYDIPSHFLLPPTAAKLASVDNSRGALSPESTIAVASSPRGSGGLLTRINTSVTEGLRHDHEKGEVKNEPLAFDPYLVGWNGDDDPENPRCVYTLVFQKLFSIFLWLLSNWSFAKRAFTTFSISFLAFSVYIGSAIYTSAVPGLMEAYDISLAEAMLGLTLYILGKTLRYVSIWPALMSNHIISLWSWTHVLFTASGIANSRA